jgi:hypothetical protein
VTTFPALQIVDEDNETDVLWDFNDPTGAANPNGLKTMFGLDGQFELLAPETELLYFDSETRDGGSMVYRRRKLTPSTCRMRTYGTADLPTKLKAIGRLQELMERGGVLRWQPNAITPARFIDFEPSKAPAVFDGHTLELQRVINALDTTWGMTILFMRQPLLRIASLSPATNPLANPTMLVDRDGSGRPDGYTYDATTNVTGELIDALLEAYTFSLNSTTLRELRNNTEPTAANGQTWTISADVMTEGSAQIALSIEYLNSGGTMQTESNGTLAAYPSWTRISLTFTATNATTARVRGQFRFQNSASGTHEYHVRNLQLEQAAVAGTFVVGEQTISNDPSVVGQGCLVPIYIDGDAPAPAEIEITMGSGAQTNAVRYASRWNTGVVGHRLLADYANRSHVRMVDAITKHANYMQATDATAIGGAAAGMRHHRQLNKNQGNSTTPSVTWSSTTLAGSTVLVILWVDPAGTNVVVTNPGGSYVSVINSDPAVPGTQGAQVRVLKIENASAQSGAVNWTLATSRAWNAWSIELQGGGVVNGTPSVQQNATSTTVTSTATTPTVPDSVLLFLGGSSLSGETYSAPTAGFSLLDQNGTNMSSFVAQRIVTALPGATNPSMTQSTTARNAAVVIAISLDVSMVEEQRLFSHTISTKLDSLRGTFEVYLRVKPTASTSWRFQLRYGASSVVSNTNTKVTRDWTNATTFGWVLVDLGTLSLPHDVALAQLTLELWAERLETANASGDVVIDELIIDSYFLMPIDDTAVLISQESGDTDSWLGSELIAPDEGGTIGTTQGSEMWLNGSGQKVGTPPLKGTYWPVGLTRFEVAMYTSDQSADEPCTLAIRNTTTDSDLATLAVTLPKKITATGATTTVLATISGTLVADNRYQLVVRSIGATPDVHVKSVARRQTPLVTADQAIVSDPELALVYTIDSSDNFVRRGMLQGPQPDVLEPGLHLLWVQLLDQPLAGFEDYEHVLSRTATVKVTYAPRVFQ